MLKKLNQMGMLSLHVLLPVLLAIGGTGAIGLYVMNRSDAATLLTSKQCKMLGRTWSGSACKKVCLPKAGSLVTKSPYDYCTGALSTSVSQTKCSSLRRAYFDGGCVRNFYQNSDGSWACASSSAAYKVANPYDYCIL